MYLRKIILNSCCSFNQSVKLMVATLAATFTFISCVWGWLCIIIKIFGILFSQLSVKPWTVNVKLKILRIFMRSVYGNMVLQLAMYYVSSHASACYFLILRYSGVFEPTFMARRHGSNDSQPWLATRRSRIASTVHVIYYLARSFVYLA